MTATATNQRWSVRIRATVIKTVYCEGCTQEQACDKPYDFATNEVEDFTEDYDVQSCVPVPDRTVSVRIAVAVDAEGQWYAHSRSGETDEQKMKMAKSLLKSPNCYWLTATLPVPQPVEVQVEVTPAKE